MDSSGFNTANVLRWLDTKHGTRTSQSQREWVKAHLMVGVQTNIVTSVEMSRWKGATRRTSLHSWKPPPSSSRWTKISADKAYLTKRNVELVESVGAVPFVPFKSDTRDVGMVADTAWARMYHRFMADRETFMAGYHKRSNVETTFSMIKMKFGASVCSKSPVGQATEVLCKVLAHNIVVVGQAGAEFEIDPAIPDRCLAS